MATAAVAASASGDNVLVAAVTGKKIRVHGYALSAAGAVNAKFRSGTTDITGLFTLAAAGSETDGTERANDPDGLFETVAGAALNLNLSSAVAVGGWVDYSLE